MKTATSVTVALAIGLMLSLPGVLRAQIWVEVKGGNYALAPDQLAHLKETLPARVLAAAKEQGVEAPDWQKFLIQYSPRKMHGVRVVEVHGSCEVAPGEDVKRRFIDETVVDGGTCYFAVIYILESDRYSNVVFHGYG
jgi:hypothetical protein